MPSDPSLPARELQISERAAGMRVDQFLSARFRSLSRSAATRAVREGLVQSNIRPLKASSTLHDGEVLSVRIPGYAPSTPPPPTPDVVYEDERLIVVNKPPRLLVHPAGDQWEWAVVGLVRDARPGATIDLAHRLDRDTSGLLVLSKNADCNAFLKEQFRTRSRDLAKVYLAVVRGVPNWNHREVDAPIGVDDKSEIGLRRCVRDNGLPAWTTVRVLERWRDRDLALVTCHIHTGRTHQIRVHLEHLGLPILGDRMYGHDDRLFLDYLRQGATPSVRARAQFPRQCLHAWRMRLPHPSGSVLELEAPPPEDLCSLMNGAPAEWKEETP